MKESQRRKEARKQARVNAKEIKPKKEGRKGERK